MNKIPVKFEFRGEKARILTRIFDNELEFEEQIYCEAVGLNGEGKEVVVKRFHGPCSSSMAHNFALYHFDAIGFCGDCIDGDVKWRYKEED